MRARTSLSTNWICSTSARFSGSRGGRIGESFGRPRECPCERGLLSAACVGGAFECDGGRQGRAMDGNIGCRGGAAKPSGNPGRAVVCGRAVAVAAEALLRFDELAKSGAGVFDVLSVPLWRSFRVRRASSCVFRVRMTRSCVFPRRCDASGASRTSRFVPTRTKGVLLSNSSPSARNSGFPNGTPRAPCVTARVSSTASGSAVQYTLRAPLSTNPNLVYPPTMRSDFARLSYTRSISSASTAWNGSSFS
mmetsp:Transcript_3212/g.11188  ORF Transcript_3212/g.11188 Transcript_3212/m.11188 type:complete len:250 (+) Transcript_3212:723-1472(+)